MIQIKDRPQSSLRALRVREVPPEVVKCSVAVDLFMQKHHGHARVENNCAQVMGMDVYNVRYSLSGDDRPRSQNVYALNPGHAWLQVVHEHAQKFEVASSLHKISLFPDRQH